MPSHDTPVSPSPSTRPKLTLGRPRTLVNGAAVKAPTGTSPDVNERAWMVWGEGRRNPRVRHPSKDAAVQEAERLAGLNPGVVYAVFELTRVARRLK